MVKFTGAVLGHARPRVVVTVQTSDSDVSIILSNIEAPVPNDNCRVLRLIKGGR